MAFSNTEKSACIQSLRDYIQPEQRVYTKLNHVSQSGMMRVIDLYVVKDGNIVRITWSACAATDTPYNRKHEGMKMNGCGMDMGFAAVYNLSHALFGNGYAINHQWL